MLEDWVDEIFLLLAGFLHECEFCVACMNGNSLLPA